MITTFWRAYVRAHKRRLPDGRVVYVRAYERRDKPGGRRGGGREGIIIIDAGNAAKIARNFVSPDSSDDLKRGVRRAFRCLGKFPAMSLRFLTRIKEAGISDACGEYEVENGEISITPLAEVLDPTRPASVGITYTLTHELGHVLTVAQLMGSQKDIIRAVGREDAVRVMAKATALRRVVWDIYARRLRRLARAVKRAKSLDDDEKKALLKQIAHTLATRKMRMRTAQYKAVTERLSYDILNRMDEEDFPAKFISAYSYTDPLEMVAEAFERIYGRGKPDEVPAALRKLCRDVLNGVYV